MSIVAAYELVAKIKDGIGGDVDIYLATRGDNIAIRTYWNDETNLGFERLLSSEAIIMSMVPDQLVDHYIAEAKYHYKKATSK